LDWLDRHEELALLGADMSCGLSIAVRGMGVDNSSAKIKVNRGVTFRRATRNKHSMNEA